MTTAKIQRTDLLTSQELDGAIIRLVTRSRVIELSDTSLEVLNSALAAAGIPAAGSSLTGYPNLILKERNTTLVDQSTVDVDLVYEPFYEDQDLDIPITSVLSTSARANVQQITTNLDKDGNTITVEHTYPFDDPNFPGETIEQGGEIQVFVPQRTISVRGVKDTTRPWLITNSIIGKINNAPWMGEGLHEWMCVTANWELLSAVPVANKYRMEFVFQHNAETWNPQVVFIDSETGKPPKDLVEGTGFKTIRSHEEVNFESILGLRLQAG